MVYPSMCSIRLFKDDTTASIYVASPQAIQCILLSNCKWPISGEVYWLIALETTTTLIAPVRMCFVNYISYFLYYNEGNYIEPIARYTRSGA